MEDQKFSKTQKGQTAVKLAQSDDDHYLKEELYALVREDPAIFEFLQAGSLDGLWYWDLEELENEWMNPRFWEVLGFDPAEREHKASEWQDLIHPDDLKVALDNFAKHSADPNHPYDQVVRYRHRDGSTVWVRCRGLIIRDQDDLPVRMLGAHTELTELKLTEEALEASVKELEAFSYSVSHDLRAPLRAIDGFSRILAEDHATRLDDEGMRLLNVIRGNAQKMGLLIDDLLKFSRLGRQELAFSSVDMTSMAQSVFKDLSNHEQNRQIDFKAAELPSVYGDPSLLRQVWTNLFSNALKYTRQEEVAIIEVTGEVRDKDVVYCVVDNGVGFDMQYADKLFGVFQRLHADSTFEGTGVGLALISRIIKRHGGRVWAEAAPDEGAKFLFALPQDAA